jgi:hypothetical protein
MKALFEEKRGKLTEAANLVRRGRSIARKNGLRYKETDCDYHIGHLILRHLDNRHFASNTHIKEAMNALSSAISFYKAELSTENEYLKNCIKARKILGDYLETTDLLKT